MTLIRKRSQDARLEQLEKNVQALQAIIDNLQTTTISQDVEVLDRFDMSTIISPSEQQRLFKFCRFHMLNFWKVIRIPASKSYDEVKQERPLLVKSMIAAGALMLAHPQAEALSQVARAAALHAFLEEGERSIQLIQSYTLFTVWTPMYTKENLLRFGTHMNLALQIASELEEHSSTLCQDVWDDAELARVWMHIFINHTSAKYLQERSIKAQVPWTDTLESFCSQLRGSSCILDKSNAFMAHFMATNRPLVDPHRSQPISRAQFQRIKDAFEATVRQYEGPMHITIESSMNAGFLFILEYWCETIADSYDPSDVSYANDLLDRYMKDLFTILDKILPLSLDAVPTHLLIRPLTALVGIGRICHLIRADSVFKEAVKETRDRFEVMALTSHFCAQLSDRIDSIVSWYDTSAHIRAVPLAVITSAPCIDLTPQMKNNDGSNESLFRDIDFNNYDICTMLAEVS